MAGGGGGGKGEPEFQVAPMIDVLLVLLIFVLSITSAQVLTVDKSITLPISANAVKKDNSRSEAIVNVRWDEGAKKATYIMDEKPYTDPAALGAALAAAKRIGETKVAKGPNPTFRCVIRADRLAMARTVATAMNAAAEAGISDISFSAVNRQ